MRMAEHRWVVLQHRGHLGHEEVVHHVDRDPKNNAIKNLVVLSTQAEHKQFEAGGAVQPAWRGGQCSCPRCKSNPR